MIQFFKNNIEPRKKLRTAEIIVLIELQSYAILYLELDIQGLLWNSDGQLRMIRGEYINRFHVT